MPTRHSHRRWDYRPGFSLGEMLATVIIGAMILTAILGIYGRANQAANAVLAKVESPAMASEVLQLIARDLDRTFGADDVVVQIRNGFDRGFPRAELVLRRVFHDKDTKEQVLEEITWRAAYDAEGSTPGLIIYRSREGMGREDKLPEDQRKDWEKSYPFVPICRGATFFQIQAYKGEEIVDQWPAGAASDGGEGHDCLRGILRDGARNAGRPRRAEDQPDHRGQRDAKDQVRVGRVARAESARRPQPEQGGGEACRGAAAAGDQTRDLRACDEYAINPRIGHQWTESHTDKTEIAGGAGRG